MGGGSATGTVTAIATPHTAAVQTAGASNFDRHSPTGQQQMSTPECTRDDHS